MGSTIPGRMRALAGTVAMLAGCALGPDFKRPDPPHVERYTAQELRLEMAAAVGESEQHVVPGEQLRSDWWRLFQSDALDRVVERALAGNRKLAGGAAPAPPPPG